jgi:transcriptional regulator
MNISEYFYNNQAKKVSNLIKRMDKELLELKKEVFDGASEEDIDIYFATAKIEYMKKANSIIDRYEKLVIKEQNKVFTYTGEFWGFKDDKKLEKQKAHNEKEK